MPAKSGIRQNVAESSLAFLQEWNSSSSRSFWFLYHCFPTYHVLGVFLLQTALILTMPDAPPRQFSLPFARIYLTSKKAKNTRLKFNLDKLKDPNISNLFEARIGVKFGPLLLLERGVEAITNNFNEVMTEVATDILGFSRPKTQPWATDDILNMCDTRRLLKPQRETPAGKIEYRQVNKQIKKEVKEAKQKWIDDQCEEIEHSTATNNTKKAYQLVKTLTKQQQGKVNNIQHKGGKCLTEGEDKTKRWTEYCSELYTFQNKGDQKCTNLSGSNGGREIPNPQTRSGIGHQNIKMRKGSWS